MEFWGLTDPGSVRAQNQDAFHMERLDKHTALCIVCDGMGGAKSGNVASSLAVDVFVQEVKQTWTADMDKDQLDRMLHSAVKLANLRSMTKVSSLKSFRAWAPLWWPC